MSRKVIIKESKDVTMEDLKFITKIEVLAHRPEMVFYADENGDMKINSMGDLLKVYMGYEDETMVMLGKDWYLIYEIDDFNVTLLDMARVDPENKNERLNQQRELQNAFNDILAQCVVVDKNKIIVRIKEVATELREDTTYFLYLVKKKMGVVDQVDDDWVSVWPGGNTIKFTAQQQDEFLKNSREIRKQAQNKKIKTHQVRFVPSGKTIEKILRKNQKEREELPSLNVHTL